MPPRPAGPLSDPASGPGSAIGCLGENILPDKRLVVLPSGSAPAGLIPPEGMLLGPRKPELGRGRLPPCVFGFWLRYGCTPGPPNGIGLPPPGPPDGMSPR